jgi:hypothetical protein
MSPAVLINLGLAVLFAVFAGYCFAVAPAPAFGVFDSRLAGPLALLLVAWNLVRAYLIWNRLRQRTGTDDRWN